MAPKRKYYRWSAKISRETLPTLQDLAAELGFVVETPGGFHGDASPPAMLDALAAAYRRDPGGVHLALKVMGVYNKPGGPEPLNLGDAPWEPLAGPNS